MKERIWLFLSLHLPFLLGFLLLFGVWAGGQNRENLKNQQREERLRDESIRLVEGVRGSCTFEAQTSIYNNSFKKALVEACYALSGKAVFSAEALTSAFPKAFPETCRPPGTLIYGISFPPQGKPLLLSGAGLASSKGRVILDILERFVKAGDLSAAEKSALDSRTSGIFGENMPFEFMSSHRRGRGTPGSFEGKPAFLLWDFVKVKEKLIGAYLVVLPWQTLKLSRPLLEAIRPPPQKQRSPVVPLLVPVETAPSRLKICVPPGYVMTPAQRVFFRNARAASRREEVVPLGKLIKVHDFYVFREFLSLNLAYEVWVVCPESAFPRKKENVPLFMVGMALGCLWAGIAMRQFIIGRALFLPLKIWFPGFIAIIGAVPLWVFYEMGSMQIDVAEIRQIQERVDETVATFQEIDASNPSITGSFKDATRKLLSEAAWYQGILSSSATAFKASVDVGMRQFASSGLPLDFLLCFPLTGPEKGFSSKGPLSSGDSMVRFFLAVMNHCLKVIDYPSPKKADATSEWMSLKAFTIQQGPLGLNEVFAGNYEASMFDSGGKKLLLFHDLLSVEGVPKMFLVLLALADEGFFHRLREILKRMHSPEEPLKNFILGRAVPGGFEVDILPEQRRFWESSSGRSLEEFLRLSVQNRTRQMYQGTRSFYLVQPCRHAEGFFLGAHIPLQDIHLDAQTGRTILTCLTILVLSFILIVGMVASRRLITPLRNVESALMKAALGDLSIRVGLERDDELGLMSRSFDDMIVGLKKRKELGEFVSGTLDLSVGHLETIEAMKPEVKQGAVLVTDLRDFTALSERHDTREVVEMLNRHLEAMTTCIVQWGGLIEQIIGDAIVAVFYDSPGKSGMEAAMRAASTMYVRHVLVQRQRESKGEFGYDMGIGIDYGSILTGTIHSSGRLEQTVLGKTKKNAEHLETLSKQGRWTKIILSPAAFRVAVDGHAEREFVALPAEEGFELLRPLQSFSLEDRK